MPLVFNCGIITVYSHEERVTYTVALSAAPISSEYTKCKIAYNCKKFEGRCSKVWKVEDAVAHLLFSVNNITVSKQPFSSFCRW